MVSKVWAVLTEWNRDKVMLCSRFFFSFFANVIIGTKRIVAIKSK